MIRAALINIFILTIVKGSLVMMNTEVTEVLPFSAHHIIMIFITMKSVDYIIKLLPFPAMSNIYQLTIYYGLNFPQALDLQSAIFNQ